MAAGQPIGTSDRHRAACIENGFESFRRFLRGVEVFFLLGRICARRSWSSIWRSNERSILYGNARSSSSAAIFISCECDSVSPTMVAATTDERSPANSLRHFPVGPVFMVRPWRGAARAVHCRTSRARINSISPTAPACRPRPPPVNTTSAKAGLNPTFDFRHSRSGILFTESASFAHCVPVR